MKTRRVSEGRTTTLSHRQEHEILSAPEREERESATDIVQRLLRDNVDEEQLAGVLETLPTELADIRYLQLMGLVYQIRDEGKTLDELQNDKRPIFESALYLEPTQEDVDNYEKALMEEVSDAYNPLAGIELEECPSCKQKTFYPDIVTRRAADESQSSVGYCTNLACGRKRHIG